MTAILRVDPPPLAGAVRRRAGGRPSRDRPLSGEAAIGAPIVGARCRDVPRRVGQYERRCGAGTGCPSMWARRPAGRSSRCSPHRVALLLAVVAATWGYLCTMSDRAVNAAPREGPGAGAVDGDARPRVASRAAAAHGPPAGVVSRAEGALRGDRRRDDSRFPGHLPAAESRHAAARGARTFRHAARPHRHGRERSGPQATAG